ncbi:PREDICTED: little elongation complex subunit 1 [Nanorana parkeri]|uniref:little elongation complex subunit 1 n=1 Tax=Nanorana parkeri TaxID=125878 RepID=UPI0008547EE4|nr:PREDICTED: little elongation complex subunit 1 [Nanorana parkeri]
MLHSGSENLFQRTEKKPKLKGSQKVKYTDLICQAVSKENHQQKLSQGEQSLHNILVGENVLGNADTSTNSDHSPETITKVRSEMGPPLPPLLGPLLATPPKSVHPLSPILSSSSCSSLPSPPDDLISPLPGTPFPRLVSPLADRRRQKSPVFATPSPAEKANSRILSSPLQFCAATPKHALPVPGRLPLSASSSSSTCAQENSVKILDTMYPELSARARTLNILKGHVQLNRGLPTGGKNVSVSQITGFKPITSTSTAFIKTGGNSKADNSKDKLSSYESQQQASSIASLCKRTSDAFLMPRSAKRLRLDTESPVIETMKNCSIAPTKNDTEVQHKAACNNISYCELLPDVVKDSSVDEDIITKALKKIEDLCFDLLPVIRSHIFVGTIPKVPVMRNEEKEVICEFSNSKKSLADRFLQVILKKIKTGKKSMSTTYLQALCRVYVGLCRQLGDIERARILCYSILKEDFPDPDRLLLFIVSSWNDIISTHGVVSKAIQAVLKNLAKDDVGSCLSAYLNWEKTPPMNVSLLLSSVLMAVQLFPDGKFQQSEKYGEDLTDSIWEYVFAVDLLCSHRKWVWTHDKIISKELWPLLDKWVKRKKGNPNVSFVPDIIAATVLRLVGYLCHMGLKEGFDTAVKNIGAVIIAFLQHANEEGMCWGVQLACVYMLFDLAPSDPAAIYKTLQEWKASANNDIPPAVASCMQELESMCGSASDLT